MWYNENSLDQGHRGTWWSQQEAFNLFAWMGEAGVSIVMPAEGSAQQPFMSKVVVYIDCVHGDHFSRLDRPNCSARPN